MLPSQLSGGPRPAQGANADGHGRVRAQPGNALIASPISFAPIIRQMMAMIVAFSRAIAIQSTGLPRCDDEGRAVGAAPRSGAHRHHH
jgi:hypothetical protein